MRIINLISLEFRVILTAMLPIIELKGAIPVGLSLGLSPLHSAIISFIGSMVPVPIILFTIRPVFSHLRRTEFFGKLIDSLIDRSLRRSHTIQKYEALGLVFFVAIPIPGTGIWTGSLIASLLDIRFKWAFPAIFVGNLIAAILIMRFSQGIFSIII